jgi:prepilin-type N-terminal cleavage/methylation domain-containing protein/prepilin-type processing-associated H-X9-DG protein
VSRPPRNAPAFTLVELLVVIGIIALLISILLPTLSKTRESGRKTACMSNLRQIAMAVLSYTQEHKGFLPGPCNSGVADPAIVNATPTPFTATEMKQQLNNTDLVGPYLKDNRAIWLCPSHEIQRNTATAVARGRLLYMCYKVNNQPDTLEPFFFGSWTSTRTTYEKTPKRLSLVHNASSAQPNLKSHATIWMISDLDGRNFSIAHSAALGITDNAIAADKRAWQPQHKSGTIGRNYVFFDGHAEWLRFDAWPVNE